MVWLDMLRNVILALALILSSHLALASHIAALHSGATLGSFPRALPSLKRIENGTAVATVANANAHANKTTMPLDGLKEMFEYARADDDWGQTSVIKPPSHATLVATSPVADKAAAPVGADFQDPLLESDLGVSAFDGWSGAASFP